MIEFVEGLLSALGLKLKVVVSGSVGAFITLRFFDGLPTSDRWLMLVCGALLASFGASPLHAWLELTNPSLEGGLALLIGMFGMAVAAEFLKAIRGIDWTEILRNVIGFFKRGAGGGGTK